MPEQSGAASADHAVLKPVARRCRRGDRRSRSSPRAPRQGEMRTGVDLLYLPRFQRVLERFGQRFVGKVFTEREQMECAGRVHSLAGRFALKEAAAKALGTGLWREGVAWRDIEIVRHPVTGEPMLNLRAGAAAWAARRHLADWSVSLSHDGEYVLAFAVAV